MDQRARLLDRSARLDAATDPRAVLRAACQAGVGAPVDVLEAALCSALSVSEAARWAGNAQAEVEGARAVQNPGWPWQAAGLACNLTAGLVLVYHADLPRLALAVHACCEAASVAVCDTCGTQPGGCLECR